MKFPMSWALAALAMLAGGAGPAVADSHVLSFGVINQRSAILTAQYWNPILRYVSAKSGVPLQLKMAKTAVEHTGMVRKGEFDLVYTNHMFSPENDDAGYKVFARPSENAIQGQVVVLADAPVQSLQDLDEKEVAFPSAQAFVGYFVPMDALLRQKIRVKPLFAGNQEGAMGQLKAGRAVAAAVNSQVMRDYATREKIEYRVLWTSQSFLNIPIAAHPRVSADKVKAVTEAFVGMAADPEGQKILAASAELIKQKPPYGFLPATDSEFDNYRKFFQTTLVKVE